jgi:hypothetical protein
MSPSLVVSLERYHFVVLSSRNHSPLQNWLASVSIISCTSATPGTVQVVSRTILRLTCFLGKTGFAIVQSPSGRVASNLTQQSGRCTGRGNAKSLLSHFDRWLPPILASSRYMAHVRDQKAGFRPHPSAKSAQGTEMDLLMPSDLLYQRLPDGSSPGAFSLPNIVSNQRASRLFDSA